MTKAPIGIIGGSGLYEMAGVSGIERIPIETPFGRPSDHPIRGTLDGCPVVFLARHGVGHRLLPSEINYRANIFAMKLLGVQRILSASAVGSLREAIRPLDLVMVDQFIDRTRHREDTFFGHGIAVHVSFADPVCPNLRKLALETATDLFPKVHASGPYVCMDGPQFSTRAESSFYRSLEADVIGMTNLTEARLAREAEICYTTMALVTDYDCWREGEKDVTVETLIATLRRNSEAATSLIRRLVPSIPEERSCPCKEALAGAVITDPKAIPAVRQKELAPLLAHRLG